MKFKNIFSIIAAIVISIPASMTVSSAPAFAAIDVYSTPGTHNVNGREWRTSCEQYSSNVVRCKTNIKASQVKVVGGKYQSTTGWVFNNLTYLPSPRSSWGNNPLAKIGSWTANDGRKWRTECDTAKTGRNGCRSYNMATVVEVSGKGFKKSNKWVFNNMVNFSTSSSQNVTKPPAGSNTTVPSDNPNPVCSTTKPAGHLYTNSLDESCLLSKINYERKRAGVQPVIRDSRLDSVARNWSMTMAKAPGTSGFKHNPNVNSQVGKSLKNLGWGENVAYSSAEASGEHTHKMFMESPGHKKNMLNPRYNRVGLGVICESDGMCWTTQNFAIVG